MVGARVKIAYGNPHAFRKEIRVQKLREPAQPDQAIDRRWEADPPDGGAWREVHPPCAHRRYRLPKWIPRHIGVEGGIGCDHDVGRPAEHLLDRYLREAAATERRGNIDCTDSLDTFDVDRPRKTGVEPGR